MPDYPNRSALLLRMRVDKKRLPSNAVRVRMAEALSEMGGKVAPSAKKELKEQIEKELLTRTVPSTMVVDVYWRPRDDTLLLSSTAVAVHDQFTQLFRETFGVSPMAATPTPLAERKGAPQVTRDRLMRLAELNPQIHSNASAGIAASASSEGS